MGSVFLFCILLLIIICCGGGVVRGLDNGVGRTPAMGWNSWNRFACHINEQLIRETIDAMISTGLASYGYTYVNLDDCWASSRDASTHVILPDSAAFPSGIKALADYAHSKGLKLGIYSDAGTSTCAKRPGSLGYEAVDAQTYASWGVDYLKYDNCFNQGIPPQTRFPPMRDALNASGRAILFSMCEWGQASPATWAVPVANSWRTANDIRDSYSSMITKIDTNNEFWKYAQPGAFNDPDMLEVGNGGMTSAEYRTHYALWALAKSPLLIGCDITNMTQETFSILTNPEVIAINQDPLAVQGHKLASLPTVRRAGASNEIAMKDCNANDANQKWSFSTKDGSIKNQGKNQCLDIPECSHAADVDIQLSSCHIGSMWYCEKGRNQQWIKKGDDQSFSLVSQSSGMCADLWDAPMVVTNTCEQAAPQQTFHYLNDTQQIISSESGLCLSSVTSMDSIEIWGGPLSNKEFVALLWNRSGNNGVPIEFSFTTLGVPAGTKLKVRDLWARKDLGVFTGKYLASSVDSHASVLLKLSYA